MDLHSGENGQRSGSLIILCHIEWTCALCSLKHAFLQERELKAFRESLKNEAKLLKQEVELMPKEKRKDMFRVRKEKMDLDQAEKVTISLLCLVLTLCGQYPNPCPLHV